MTGLALGTTIAGYRIEGLAGQGGMGVVYRATQLSLGRTVALKLITPALADDPHFRERFKRESHLAASIDHPNVLPVYEAGESNGSLFISMRWVNGTDLCTLIKRGGGLEPTRAVEIIAQVAAALDAAHELDLAHRDVKPANVLIAVRAVEHAYLTDFGLVKRITGASALTRSDQFVGTIDYIAPEQIDGRGTDACSDVYSLGCVLFHCLSGRVPFEADSDITKINAHLNASPPRASDFVPGLPSGLDLVVARAMAKEPGERYRTAGDLGRAAVEAAGAIQGSSDKGLGTTRPAAPAAERVRTRRLRRRAPLGLGLAGLLIGASAVGLLVLTGVSTDESGDRSEPALGDGTLLRARGSSQVYVMKAGARFEIAPGQRAGFAYGQSVRTVSSSTLRRVPSIPRDGALVRAYRSTLVWQVRSGRREIVEPPAGADVAIVPVAGLRQIPTLPGRRPTSIRLVAPSSVQERKPFFLVARVQSPRGVPTGACVFYRIGVTRLKERANTPTQSGRCGARLKVSGFRRVRYSVHFVGDRGWRSSAASSGPIEVVPG